MANRFFDAYKQNMLGAGTRVVLLTETINVVLLDSALYAVNTATHANLSDIPAGARVVTATLTGKSITGGVFDSADPVFAALVGPVSEALALYKSTGTEATSALICYIDTATGLPVAPNSRDITVSPHSTGWFTL